MAPAAIGFLDSKALGKEYQNDLFVGASRVTLDQGYLYRFDLTKNRKGLDLQDPALADRVADNTAKFDPTEGGSLAFGTGFGVGTDIQTGPNGNLYVVSLSDGKVYEIYRPNSGNSDGGSDGGDDLPVALLSTDLTLALGTALSNAGDLSSLHSVSTPATSPDQSHLGDRPHAQVLETHEDNMDFVRHREHDAAFMSLELDQLASSLLDDLTTGLLHTSTKK